MPSSFFSRENYKVLYGKKQVAYFVKALIIQRKPTQTRRWFFSFFFAIFTGCFMKSYFEKGFKHEEIC